MSKILGLNLIQSSSLNEGNKEALDASRMLALVKNARASYGRSRIFVQKRALLTLAIETSCDDTAVAILETNSTANEQNELLKIHHEAKVTSNNLATKGVYCVTALLSHQQHCSSLVNAALLALPEASSAQASLNECLIVHHEGQNVFRRKPDIICATRGPGMRSNLQIGHEFAKGLAVAWQRPFLGVHHMHAHALTPRLVSAMERDPDRRLEPAFPFLTLLVSGGHTDLIHTKSLFEHSNLARCSDNPIGNALDLIARDVLPEEMISEAKTVMYARLMEQFAFPHGERDYHYSAPVSRSDEASLKKTQWGWSLPIPLSNTKRMGYSFSGIISTADRIMKERKRTMSLEERIELAQEVMRCSFEHLAAKIVQGFHNLWGVDPEAASKIGTLVVSGGVAANGFLRHVLRTFLDVRGLSHIKLVFPPLRLCTDNAVMIGWAGIEVFEAGYQSELDCTAIREWSLDSAAKDGGILGVPGWRSVAQNM